MIELYEEITEALQKIYLSGEDVVRVDLSRSLYSKLRQVKNRDLSYILPGPLVSVGELAGIPFKVDPELKEGFRLVTRREVEMSTGVEEVFKIGDRFFHQSAKAGPPSGEYLLAMTGWLGGGLNHVCLIDVNGGGFWANGVNVRNTGHITEGELTEICGSAGNRNRFHRLNRRHL